MAENGDKLPKAENDSDADEKQVESKYPTMNGDADTSELDADADSDSLKKDGEECQEESELEKVWSAVKQNPQDFTSWTYLLQHVEQMDDLEQARKAFDEFFELYPYCYGYWKKYADIEKKNENCDAAQKVYERGLDAIPLSVDLWIHYVTYYKSLFEENANEESTSHIRVLFERAVVAAGKEFRSDKLWEMYIIWEGESGRLLNVLNLYDRLLNTPTIQYSQHFERFKEFVEQNDPKEFLKESEYGEILKEEDTKMEQAKNDKEKKGDDEHEDEVIRDEDSKEISVDTIRVNLIARREVIFKKNEEEVAKRWNYEDGVKRPYFHVKALEKTQLKNWKEYLKFEREQGDHVRIELLYERCLIACALYEDMWLDYAKFMETSSVDAARSIYRRACLVHLPKKPTVHLAWSAFEEKLGDINSALTILMNLEQTLPGLLEVTLRRINLERRRGNYSVVNQLYQHCIDNAPTDKLKSHFSLKFARHLYKVTNEYDQAVELLEKTLSKNKGNVQLYMQLIDFAFHQKPINETTILNIFNKALKCSDIGDADKMLFSQRKIEFLEDFGSDIKMLIEATSYHEELAESITSSNKRSADESVYGGDEKRVRMDTDAYGASQAGFVAGSIPTMTQPSQALQSSDPNHAAYSYQNQQATWSNYQNAYGYPQSQWNQYQGYYPTA